MDTNIIKLSKHITIRNSIDNMAIIDTGEFLVVIDTLEDPNLNQEISSIIKSLHKPLRYIINTHNHPDHTALNQFLSQTFHAQIINSQSNIKEILGSELSIKIISIPHTHSDTDLMVHIPQEKFLACGDIFEWGLIPYEKNLTKEHWQNIITSYNLMIDINPQFIMPGHGPILSVAEIIRCKQYFIQLMNIWTSSPDNIDQTPPPNDMLNWWNFTAWKHQFSINQIKTFKQN